jgi:long-chain fatty acid transport protein
MLNSTSWRCRWSLGVIVVVSTIGAAAPAGAQSTAQLPLQFDFLAPGARSLALGGAFIGAADDATTAFVNPAGLALLSRLEFSAEVRYRRIETPFLQGGRIAGTITNIGSDTVQGPVYATGVEDYVSPAYFSFVVPLNRVTLAAYAHELVRVDSSFENDGVFQQSVLLGIVTDRSRTLPVGGSRQVTIRNYGGSVGVRLNDRLSVGGGVSAYTFDLDAAFARYVFESGLFSPPDRTIVSATATQKGSGVSLGANLGVLWTVSGSVKVGASYRYGPSFSFTQTDRIPVEEFELVRAGNFNVPDVFGAGVEWRVTPSVRVVADYDYVRYSELKEDFANIQAIDSGRPNQLKIDDAHEFHGGVEYAFLQAAKPFALRGGLWWDPDHSIRYEPTAAGDNIDRLYGATLPGGEDVMHYTVGGGIVLSNRIEINAGVDWSKRTTAVTASAVVRF